jgi:D-arabinose 1-dehydrogenase-like Zn-dependent alcohol dehydrogenase
VVSLLRDLWDFFGKRAEVQRFFRIHRGPRRPALNFFRPGVRPMIEKFPLEKVAEAYDHTMSGNVKFRAVLTMGA